MRPTDWMRAKCFFADLLLPLRHANVRRGVHYLTRTAPKTTCWSKVVSRTGGLEKLSAATSNGSALLGRLGQYWASQNDGNLTKLLPYLVSFRQEMAESHPQSADLGPQLTEFVYPMF